MKTLVTTVLVLTLLLASPAQSRPQSIQGPKNVLIACGLLAVGGVIVWGLWKLCKKIPTPAPPPGDNPPAPPPTNAPPAKGKSAMLNSSQSSQDALYLSQLNLPNVQPYDVTKYGWSDAYSPGNIFTNKFMFSLESSVNLVDWQPVWTVSVFVSSSGGELWAVSQGGSNILTSYFPDAHSPSNRLPLDFDDGRSNQNNFRLATPVW